jgi:hypothetical protein
MNLSEIRRFICDFVPGARMVRFEDCGLGVWSVACEIGAVTKSAQFTDAGIYPNDDPAAGQRSEIHIASDLARELKR